MKHLPETIIAALVMWVCCIPLFVAALILPLPPWWERLSILAALLLIFLLVRAFLIRIAAKSL